MLQTVQRTVLCMGRKQEAVENVPCGNTVGTPPSFSTLLQTPSCSLPNVVSQA